MTLYVVATPIGNRADISPRAIEVLSSVARICAEDTRHSGRLIRGLGIATPLVAYHDHTSEEVRTRLVDSLADGEDLALVSDAGTPCISDPGYRIVADALDRGVRVVAVPGASALTAFLSIAGLPTDQFLFAGFLPRKPTQRREAVERLGASEATVVTYESPRRLLASLETISDSMPDRLVAVGRELTKMHEEVVRGPARDVLTEFASRDEILGECVIGWAGAPPTEGSSIDSAALVTELASTSLRTKEMSRVLARVLGLPNDEAYRVALKARGK